VINSSRVEPRRRKWLYPVVTVVLVLISFLPLYTDIPYAPQDTQDVITSLLRVSIGPYRHLGPVFHVATLLIVVLIAALGRRMGRLLAAYMGLNYLIIAVTQTMGTTESYGFVVQTGAMVAAALLGVVWIAVAVRGTLAPSFKGVPAWRYLLLPLALLAFWAPYDSNVQPDFSPMLLLTSPDYGLTLCLTSPVFLFLLVLFYPKVDGFAYRVTAINGLIYGLLNMTHFLNPQLRWMGVLHLPLLIISLTALLLPRITAWKSHKPDPRPGPSSQA